MTVINFPKRRKDGSFTVVAHFSTRDDAVVERLNQFLARWVGENKTWHREWQSDVVKTEQLELLDDFSSLPKLESGDEEHHFKIVFNGRPESQRWKDWMVRLVDELSRAFPETTFEHFESTG